MGVLMKWLTHIMMIRSKIFQSRCKSYSDWILENVSIHQEKNIVNFFLKKKGKDVQRGLLCISSSISYNIVIYAEHGYGHHFKLNIHPLEKTIHFRKKIIEKIEYQEDELSSTLWTWTSLTTCSSPVSSSSLLLPSSSAGAGSFFRNQYIRAAKIIMPTKITPPPTASPLKRFLWAEGGGSGGVGKVGLSPESSAGNRLKER